jgi:hypothetical protein
VRRRERPCLQRRGSCHGGLCGRHCRRASEWYGRPGAT